MSQEPGKAKQARTIVTREKIVESGRELFCRDGYFSTSAKKIAAHAGVATGTFYNHFADKKALLLEVHRRHSMRVHKEVERFFTEELAAPPAPGVGLPMMKKMVEIVYKTHELSPELHREITVLALTDPEFAQMDRDEKTRAHEKLSAVLRPFTAALRIEDVEAADVLVSQSIEAIVHSLIMDEPPIPKQRLLDALADMLTRYLFK